MWPGALTLVVAVYYFESRAVSGVPDITWFTSIVLASTSLATGWILWIASRNAKGHGARLLAGLFLLMGLHGIDRPLWLQSPLFLLRIAFDHLLAVSLGIAMVVLVLERARARPGARECGWQPGRFSRNRAAYGRRWEFCETYRARRGGL